MRLDHAVIQRNAEPCAIGEGDISLNETLWWVDDIRTPGHFSPLELEELEVRHWRANLYAGRRRDRAAWIVGGDRQAVSCRHRRDAGQLEESSAVLDVGHDHVDRMFATQ